MTTRYVLDSVDSDLSGGADFNKRIVLQSSGATTINVSVAASASEVSYGFTGSGDPGSDGGTPSLVIGAEVNVTTANSAIQISVAFTRINSIGGVQATTGYTLEQSAGSTGVKVFEIDPAALGTFGANDRLRVDYKFRNTNTMSAQACVISCGSLNTEVVAPWTLPPAMIAATVDDAGIDVGAGTSTIYVDFAENVEVPLFTTTTKLFYQINLTGGGYCTYAAGSGTSTLSFTIPELVSAGDLVSLSYSHAAAHNPIYRNGTLTELKNGDSEQVVNSVTKRLRGTVKGQNGSAAASETMSYSAHTYAPGFGDHMFLEQAGSFTTDASGNFDVQFTGTTAVGSDVLLVLQRSTPTPDETVAALITIE